MGLSVGETAALYGVSIRALQYYDSIGLLCPKEKSEAGYRFYAADELQRLGSILFYRQLGIPLKTIAVMLDDPMADATALLQKQREMLLRQQQHITMLLQLVDDSLGGKPMQEENLKTAAQSAADYDKMKQQYQNEVQQRWGNSPQYRQEQQKKLSQKEKSGMMQEQDEIFKAFAFAAGAGEDPQGESAGALAARLQQCITRYSYDCTPQIYAYLADLYVQDERFTRTLDGYGPGTAAFMSKAIHAYCVQQEKENG